MKKQVSVTCKQVAETRTIASIFIYTVMDYWQNSKVYFHTRLTITLEVQKGPSQFRL